MGFGKTWWGERWLKALHQIDYQNRIPRGASYARRGRVIHMKLKGNTVEAEVTGTRPRPYKIKITIPPFGAKELKTFISALTKQPAVIAKLLNRQLDPLVLDLAKQHSLSIFPNRWNDLKMSCSCPDWAVPCKHLAAVVYQMSAEIDNDPFTVFHIHGADLLKELEKQGLHIGQSAVEVPLLKDLLCTEGKQKALPYDPARAYDRLILPEPEPMADLLVSLLEPSPVFYTLTGDFREKYRVLLQKAAKKFQRVTQGKQSLFDLLNPTGSEIDEIHPHDTFSLLINENIGLQASSFNELIPAREFFSRIAMIHPSRVVDYQAETAVLHTLLGVSVHLIAMGAIVPMVVRNQTPEYMILWKPALMSKEISELTDRIQPMIPPALFRYGQGKERYPLSHQPGVNALTLCITALMHGIAERDYYDQFLNLFFAGKTWRFDKPGEESLPGGMMMWLNRYYLSTGRFRPGVLIREDKDADFMVDMVIQPAETARDVPVPLLKVYEEKRYSDHRFEILTSLSALSPWVPGLDQYINAQGKTPIRMGNEAFAGFLTQLIPAIRLLKISVILPKSLESLIKPRPTLRLTAKGNVKSSISLKSVFDFEWRVALGDQFVSEEEFHHLMHSAEGLIKFKSGFIYANREEIERIRKFFSKSRNLNSGELIRIAFGGEFEGAPVEFTADAEALIRSIREVEEVELPEGITATLRPYQIKGYSWLYKNATIGLGSVIADDMGLGKTLQVITTLQKFMEEGELFDSKALVVAPTGLLANWQAEVEKFAPEIITRIYHGSNRNLPDAAEFDLLITSYGVVRSDAEVLQKRKWKMVIVDEAQNIKNPQAQQTKAVKSLKGEHYIAMSGTPVENRLSELWSIMDFTNKGLMGNLKEFQEHYSYAIEQMNNPRVAEQLKKITAPFLLRRMKTDKTIISDLPDKIEINTYASLTSEQAVLYQKTLDKAMEAIEGITSSDSESLFKRQGLILQMILALKQICNHPAQFLKNGGDNPAQSGKAVLLFDTLDTILERNEKVLIFSQFKQMGDLLHSFITRRYTESPLFLHGGCTTRQRTEMIHRFQNNPADKLFLLSLKAAGTGLNLTAANHVIHYDLWWNPAVEAQATDRAYRIGQKNNVMVHRFITKDTFEEKIDAMIQSKKHLAEITLAAGENWIGKLSNKELRQLFG